MYEENKASELNTKSSAPSISHATVRREKPGKPPRPRTGDTAGTKIRIIKAAAEPNETFEPNKPFETFALSNAFWEKTSRLTKAELQQRAEADNATRRFFDKFEGSGHPHSPFTPTEWAELRTLVKKQMNAQTPPSQSELLASACELVYLVLTDKGGE